MKEQGQAWRSVVRHGGAGSGMEERGSGMEEQGQVWRSRVRYGGAGSGMEERGQ